MRPLIVTLTGPSCAGKSTLEDILTKRGFEAAISVTTRERREGEIDGEDYYFVTEAEFEGIECANGFIETVCFGDNQYGVTSNEITRLTATGKPIVIVVEPNGREQIAEFAFRNSWDIYTVYIGANPEVISQRFLSRYFNDTNSNSDREEVTRRFAKRMVQMMTTETYWVGEAENSERVYSYKVMEFNENMKDIVVSQLIETARSFSKNV